ncbi:MAG: hydroxyacylglutathione hydrolase [Desulfobacterales bacterium]|nr:MAG: hydroxyacylglutathione hydrolase [Desulfobacterales bacterium]
MKVFIIPCHFDNYSYILADETTGDNVIIDPCEGWPILSILLENKLKPGAMLCTHHHHDHIDGLDDIRAEYPGIAVYGHQSDTHRIPGITHPVADGDLVQAGSLSGQVLHTPGHTTGSVVYRFADLLFTGDTLFGAGCGRLFEGSPRQMMESLEKITAGDPAGKLYFGHEYTVTNLRFSMQLEPENKMVLQRYTALVEAGRPSTPSTIGEELMTNPFLRCREPGIITWLKKHDPCRDFPDQESVFTRIREIRNDFS